MQHDIQMTREHKIIHQVRLNWTILVLLFSLNNEHFVLANLMGKLADLRNHTIQISSRQILEYGADCTQEEAAYSEYSARTSEEMNKISSLSEMETELDKYNAANKQFLSTYRHLCNSIKLLACDKVSNRCECGPRHFLNREFIYVRNSHGDCFWSENSPCIAIDQLPSHNLCANNTNCTFKSFKGENIFCNNKNIFQHVTNGVTKEAPQCFYKRELEINIQQTSNALTTRNSGAGIETEPVSNNSNIENSSAEEKPQQTSNALSIGASSEMYLLAFTCIFSLCFYA